MPLSSPFCLLRCSQSEPLSKEKHCEELLFSKVVSIGGKDNDHVDRGRMEIVVEV
jgi:hypothetical protein